MIASHVIMITSGNAGNLFRTSCQIETTTIVRHEEVAAIAMEEIAMAGAIAMEGAIAMGEIDMEEEIAMEEGIATGDGIMIRKKAVLGDKGDAPIQVDTEVKRLDRS